MRPKGRINLDTDHDGNLSLRQPPMTLEVSDDGVLRLFGWRQIQVTGIDGIRYETEKVLLGICQKHEQKVEG